MLNNVEKAAAKYFGLTQDYRTAGFMLSDGSMLDFSGAHWLDRDFYTDKEIADWKKQNQLRQADHEDVYEVVKDFVKGKSVSDHRRYFMELGAIRLNPEAPGFNVLAEKEPTKEQYKALKDFILDIQNDKNFLPDRFFVDIEEKNPGKIFYPAKVSADRIINDLKDYYKTGKRPQPENMTAQYK